MSTAQIIGLVGGALGALIGMIGVAVGVVGGLFGASFGIKKATTNEYRTTLQSNIS